MGYYAKAGWVIRHRAGRDLQGIYALIVQHRLEWIEPAVRDAAEDGQPIVTAVEVVTEKVKP